MIEALKFIGNSFWNIITLIPEIGAVILIIVVFKILGRRNR